MRALLAGASAVEEQRRLAAISAIRLAVWGKPEDIQALVANSSASPSQDTTNEALTAFGLRPE